MSEEMIACSRIPVDGPLCISAILSSMVFSHFFPPLNKGEDFTSSLTAFSVEISLFLVRSVACMLRSRPLYSLSSASRFLS